VIPLKKLLLILPPKAVSSQYVSHSDLAEYFLQLAANRRAQDTSKNNIKEFLLQSIKSLSIYVYVLKLNG